MRQYLQRHVKTARNVRQSIALASKTGFDARFYLLSDAVGHFAVRLQVFWISKITINARFLLLSEADKGFDARFFHSCHSIKAGNGVSGRFGCQTLSGTVKEEVFELMSSMIRKS